MPIDRAPDYGTLTLMPPALTLMPPPLSPLPLCPPPPPFELLSTLTLRLVELVLLLLSLPPPPPLEQLSTLTDKDVLLSTVPPPELVSTLTLALVELPPLSVWTVSDALPLPSLLLVPTDASTRVALPLPSLLRVFEALTPTLTWVVPPSPPFVGPAVISTR